MSLELHDWSVYLGNAERSLKKIEQQLLNKKYDGIGELAAEAVKELQNTVVWVLERDGNKNILSVLESYGLQLEEDQHKAVFDAAIREIKRLEAERSFYYGAGIEAGKAIGK